MGELAWGSVAAMAAAALMLLGVTRELAPAGGLTGRGRWLLAVALGTGVVAFAVKLMTIIVFTLAPDPWLHQSLGPAHERAESGEPTVQAAPVRRARWQSLPLIAPSPAGNPTSAAKVELGRRLFNEKNLSSTGEVACASCHDLLGSAGADGRVVARGVGGQEGRRNTPTVWNAAFQTRLFWDGRALSLEEQALGPITNPIEMGMPSVELVVQRLAQDVDYQAAFAAAFGPGADGPDGAVSASRLAAALAAFERVLITPDSPYDRFVRGDNHAMTPLQVKGMTLFESVGCIQCHSGPNFSGASTFDGGAPFRIFPASPSDDLVPLGLSDDPGRSLAINGPGVWRIPSLRNVAVTAPYFHNGSVTELKDAVRIMARTQLGLSPGQDRSIAVLDSAGSDDQALIVQPVTAISESDMDALTAFLESLTSPRFVAVTARQGGTSRRLR